MKGESLSDALLRRVRTDPEFHLGWAMDAFDRFVRALETPVPLELPAEYKEFHAPLLRFKGDTAEYLAGLYTLLEGFPYASGERVVIRGFVDRVRLRHVQRIRRKRLRRAADLAMEQGIITPQERDAYLVHVSKCWARRWAEILRNSHGAARPRRAREEMMEAFWELVDSELASGIAPGREGM
jgi:hypothetical protein